MALQTSGPISMSEIIGEAFGSSGGTSTLGSCASVAGISSPTSMSDFYGYSAATGAVDFGYHAIFSLGACSISSGSYTTYYHDGTGTLPVINDKIYTDASQTSYAPNGYYSNGTTFFRVFYNAGSIIQVTTC